MNDYIKKKLLETGWKEDGNCFYKETGQIDRSLPPNNYVATIEKCFPEMPELDSYIIDDDDVLDLLLFDEKEIVTVKEVFEVLCEGIDDDDRCFIGRMPVRHSNTIHKTVLVIGYFDKKLNSFRAVFYENGIWKEFESQIISGDISDCDAECFVSVFGKEYSRALEGLK